MDGYGYMDTQPKKKKCLGSTQIFLAKILNEPRAGR
jgi:hypothetical protein